MGILKKVGEALDDRFYNENEQNQGNQGANQQTLYYEFEDQDDVSLQAFETLPEPEIIQEDYLSKYAPMGILALGCVILGLGLKHAKKPKAKETEDYFLLGRQ